MKAVFNFLGLKDETATIFEMKHGSLVYGNHVPIFTKSVSAWRDQPPERFKAFETNYHMTLLRHFNYDVKPTKKQRNKDTRHDGSMHEISLATEELEEAEQ